MARRLYRSYSPERLDEYMQRQIVRRRVNRRKATEKRTKEARDGIRLLRERGYSYGAIGRLCGISTKAVSEIDRGVTKWTRPSTVDRIYKGLFVAINAPLGGNRVPTNQS